MCVSLLLDIASKKAFDIRCDGSPFCPYPSPTRFGVNKERFTFKSGSNTLVGYKYFADGEHPKAKVVFFHGFGAGHTAYSHEIASIVKKGYVVYSFDYTGCMESEGRNIISLAQSVLDMDAFFAYLSSRDEYKNLSTYSVGHSLGGFVALLSLDKKYGVSKAVSLAGLPSIAYAFAKFAPMLKNKEKAISKYIKKRFSSLAGSSAFEVAIKSNKPFLYIQGDLDEVVAYKDCLPKFKELSSTDKKAFFLTVKNRHHQPYYDLGSCNYFNKMFNELHFTSPYHPSNLVLDEPRLFKDDEQVMKTIFDFLSKEE